jgi:hypothetical protein
MRDDQTDGRFESFLKEAARDYHTPPATPRDTMWARIEEARRASPKVTPIRVQSRPWARWGLAAAAILAVGVGLGRWSSRPSEDGRSVSRSPSGGRASAYQFAAGQHLNRVETLLSSFRVEARSGSTDQLLAATARDLLATHRLLLDAPAASRDPRLKRLLDDLELVLAQIAQLSQEQDMDASDLILQALDDGGVLLRLRASPAARSAVSAQGVL